MVSWCLSNNSAEAQETDTEDGAAEHRDTTSKNRGINTNTPACLWYSSGGCESSQSALAYLQPVINRTRRVSQCSNQNATIHTFADLFGIIRVYFTDIEQCCEQGEQQLRPINVGEGRDHKWEGWHDQWNASPLGKRSPSVLRYSLCASV